MNIPRALLVVVPLLTPALVPAQEAGGSREVQGQTQSLTWLAGCWRHVKGSTQETWSADYGGLMFGYSVTLRDGQLKAFEDMRIEPTADGIDFIASPNGKKPVRFRLVEQARSTVTFANPQHDFPQRISYTRDGDQLRAVITATDGSNAIEFEMTACKKSP